MVGESPMTWMTFLKTSSEPDKERIRKSIKWSISKVLTVEELCIYIVAANLTKEGSLKPDKGRIRKLRKRLI